jgi:NAD(P)-dependent dehydrogenase (short-subunit alcohol dehydrogenase family)
MNPKSEPLVRHPLAGRRVLIVGGSSGIGRATGVAACMAGARVALAARRVDSCREAVAELGADAVALPCDVRDPTACDAVVAAAVEAMGGLDAFVYAVGVSPLVRLADAELETWRTVVDSNLIGASLVCRAALPHLRASKGRALFLSSTSVGRPYPALSIYAASKAALEEMIRGWRAENPDLCFSCIVVGPTIGTEIAATWNMELAAEMVSFWIAHGYDAGTLPVMQSEDVAATVVSVLASPVCLTSVIVHADPSNGVT